jgi:hypothetical protein
MEPFFPAGTGPPGMYSRVYPGNFSMEKRCIAHRRSKEPDAMRQPGSFSMNKIAIAVLMTFVAGTAFASDGSEVSKNEMAMMKKCKSMSESAMKADNNCMAMMKKHPDMMKMDTTGSGDSGMGSKVDKGK